ncbi:F-box protein [Carex littledalei]|uniref:F-box protein n=1 Tax=Carex littledalei TaxID=544730 RepID=A0A833QBM5_9POAL|nr:F-box protein [Carex littledalei]
MAFNVGKGCGRVRVRRLSRRSIKGDGPRETKEAPADDHVVSVSLSSDLIPIPGTREWSELPIDVWRLIAEGITFPHLHKFALGCKMWCTVSKEILDKNSNSYLPPLLFLPYNEKTKTCRFVTPESECHSNSNSKSYDLKVPELNGQWICGSTKGWLAIMDDKNFDLALFNPLTRRKVSLPRFDPEIIKAHLRIYPKDDCPSRRHPTTWPRFAMKIVTSDNLDSSRSRNNCLVGVIFGHDHRLAISRLGDDSWSTVIAEGRPMRCFSDLMFYEGKLYAVGPDHVLLLDYNGPNNLSIKRIITPWNRDPEAVLGTYIVMSSGNLLVVDRYWSYEFGTRPKHEPTMTDDFIVYKMDQETETWCEIEHLQGQSLFLGLNSSMSVSALDKGFSPWCRNNCIYFLDDSELRYRLQYRGYQWDNGIFSMDEGCVVHLFPTKQYSISFWHTSPLWFFQNV